MPPSAPSTEALPDPLLGDILGLAGLSEGPSVILVSKRWNRLFYTEPSLWRSFRMAPGPFYPARWTAASGAAQLQAKHSLLRRVRGRVEELEFRDHGLTRRGVRVRAGGGAAGHPFLAHALSLLQPTQMTRLVFDCSQQMPPQAAAALSRFTQLLILEFGTRSSMPRSLPPSLPAILARLPQLRTLACHSEAALPTGLVEAIIQHLTQLTSLTLESEQPLPALQQLSRLTQLQHLGLIDWAKGDAPRLFPEPSSFPNLRTFDFSATSMVQVGGARLTCAQVGGPPKRGWRSICASDGGGSQLFLDEAVTLPGLHQLFTALLPPGGTLAVRTLRLRPSDQMDAVALDPASWRSPLLTALTSLAFRAYNYDNVAGAQMVLEEVMAQATQLRTLVLEGCQLDVLPACVVGKAGLHTLMIQYCGLVDLPPGPYLSTLHTLHLACNHFTRLPPVLAAATSLRELDIRSFQGRPWDLSLSDLEMLAGLPHLTKLQLGLRVDDTRPGMQRLVRALKRRLPRLTVV